MKWFFIMLLLVIPLTSAVLIVGDDDFNINEQRGIFLERIPTNISAADINQTGNSLFWRLDASNDDQLSSIWDMGGFGFNNLNMTNEMIFFDDTPLTFGTDEDLQITWGSVLGRLELRPPSGQNIDLQFTGNLNSGRITWDNTENQFQISEHVLITTGEQLRFGSDVSFPQGKWILVFDGDNLIMTNRLGTGEWKINSTVNFTQNISVDGFYLGNGSQLTDVCLIDLSNCMSFFNNTNVAYANNTNNFTENQNFDNNINLNGNLSSDDGVVKIANRVNISWDNQGLLSGCFTWDRDIIAESSSICSPVSSVLRLDSSVINLFAQTVNVGRGADDEECLGFVVSGTDGSFCYQSDSPARFNTGIAQSAIEFSTWYGSSIPASFPNNISWNNVLAGELFMDVPIVRIRGGGLNASTDVCIEGGQCLSNIPPNTIDTNATTECSGDEVLLGNSSCATLSDFMTMGSDTNATTECSGDEVLLGNSSCETTTDFLGGGHTTSFYSMSTQKNSLLVPSIINPFASTNYSNYKYLNYSFSGLTYDSLIGLWTASQDGTFAMQVDWDGVFQSTTSEAKQIFLINGATQYERVFIVFQSTGAEEERHSAMVILTLNDGDTIEYKLESTQGACLPGCTVQTLNGTTMNIWQLA